MSTLDKIKQKLKTANSRNIIYIACLAILVMISLFILITIIIQTDWVQIKGIQSPLLIWMIVQPHVGVFFIPFLILIIYICSFIVSVAKPITIKKIKTDSRILFENDEIEKNDYETIYETLTKAEIRKIEKEKMKEEEIKRIIQAEIKAEQQEKEVKDVQEKDI